MQDLDKISINFILSTERTGSTLLTSMLNMHLNVIATVEEPFALNLYSKYSKVNEWDSIIIEEYCNDFYLFNNGYLDIQFSTKENLILSLTENIKNLNVLNAIKLTYLQFYPKKSKKEVTTIIDKQLHFHHHLNDINNYYPNSKFVVLVRDPRDNVYLKQKLFDSRCRKKDIYILAKSWDFIFSKIFRFIRQINEDRTLIIKYEDLVSNPEEELLKICVFLNIKYEPRMLDFHKEISIELKKYIDTVDQKEKSFYEKGLNSLTKATSKDKIGIWKKYLTPKQSNLIWSICSETAQKYSYNSDSSKKIFYSNFLFKDFYLNFILRKKIITNLYKKIPFKIKVWIKRRKLNSL